MTLYGWDASDFDWPRGPMDLAAARADGITWATHKATEGTSVRHVHTGDFVNRARAAGFEFIGTYHVVRTGNVNAQVAYYLGYLDQVCPWWRTFPGWIHQIDLELWSYDPVSAQTGLAFARALIAAQPAFVVMYASRGQYGAGLAGCPAPLWNAAYGTNPAVHYPDAYRGDGSANWAPYSGIAPAFWQYGSQLRIGTQPGADCSAYRGSVADLRSLITRNGEPNMSAQVLVRYADAPDRADGSPGYLQVYLADGQRQRPLSDSLFVLPAGGVLQPKPGLIGNDGTHADNMLGNLGNGGQVFLVGPGGWADRDAWGAIDAPASGGGGGITGGDLAAAVAEINAETRDAVADLGEGGAAQVRANT